MKGWHNLISTFKGSLRSPGYKRTERAKVKAEKWIRIIWVGVCGDLDQSGSCGGRAWEVVGFGCMRSTALGVPAGGGNTQGRTQEVLIDGLYKLEGQPLSARSG